jgi:hypothetical protein
MGNNTCYKALKIMLYAFLWVIHRRLWFKYQRFGTLCLFHLHRRVGMNNKIKNNS